MPCNYKDSASLQIEISCSKILLFDSLGFTYGRGDQAVEGHCRGGDGGEEEVIDLEVGEIITGIKARTGSLFDQVV